MRFTRSEVDAARDLKALGLPWRARLGDWYATADGFVAFVRGQGDALAAAERHTWLPDWGTCRRWLQERGYTHPEFARDDPDEIRIEFIGPETEIVVGTGTTDLECVYAIMAQVLRRRGG